MSSTVLPKFYRQRFLLQFLDQAGGELSKIDLQKLLFLAHQRVNVRHFDFVPFYYGCYSFQAASDLDRLQDSGWVKITENNIVLRRSVDRLGFNKDGEKTEIRKFFSSYGNLRGNSLIDYVYKHFPYYTTNSKMADKVGKKSTSLKTLGDGSTLFTIGYEGLSFEAYVNKLIINNIHILCDVRKNPSSRKFGFSKKTLTNILPKIGIEYLHIPELGILSSQRLYLRTSADYQELFAEYSKALPSKRSYVKKIHSLVTSKKNVVLTCFEHQAERCHRSHIGCYLEKNHSLDIVHL